VVAVTATAHADPSKSATATVTLAATVVVAVQPAHWSRTPPPRSRPGKSAAVPIT
jgi:hypothetical protein